VGAPPPPAAIGADTLRLFEGVARLIAAQAVRRPLLLVLEDLHWADDTSLRLLAFVARRVAAWPVLLVVTAREEEPETPALVATLHALAHDATPIPLRLGPLSRKDTLELVDALAGPEAPVSPDLGERVWATAAGHPLMIVEAMRALATGGWLPGAPELTLPERVRELIGRRLSRLSEPAQRLAAVAAVIAREFDPALLQRAAGVGAQEAADGVDELLRHRVLQSSGERLAFTHDRILSSMTVFPP
jgi:predicted ATPase